jgi:3-hydroxyacyl-[acyl-carrier-protein] dehydratase
LLLNNLYTIQSITESENQIEATIRLLADHAIFAGHFPGQPVLPGVCMMEMVAETMGIQQKNSFRITGAPLIKFLRMIDPRMNPLIRLEIKYQQTSVSVTTEGRIFSGPDVFMKFQISLVPESVI